MNIKIKQTLYWNHYWKQYEQKKTTINKSEYIPKIQPGSILEIGCGEKPIFTTPIPLSKVYAFDTSSYLINMIKNNYKHISFIHGYFPIDSPDTQYYNTIIMRDIFKMMQLELIQFTIREARDLLSTNGTFILEKSILLKYPYIEPIILSLFNTIAQPNLSFKWLIWLKQIFFSNSNHYIYYQKKEVHPRV